MRRPITVSVISDVGVVAAGVRSLLGAHTERILVVDSSDAGPIDVVLVDPTGRSDADLQLLDRLARDPMVATVALYSSSVSMRAMRDARRFGVRSFLSTSMEANDLADALVDIADGRVIEADRSRPSGATWIGREDGLTERESEVLLLCADGLSNREIAEALYVNVETVKSHLKHAYGRLGLRNRAQAAAYVHRVSSPNRMVPLGWSPDVRAGTESPRTSTSSPSVDRSIDDVLIDAAAITDRLRVMGLDDEVRALLHRYGAAVDEGAAAFVQRLAARWSAHEHTAPLVDDPATLQRLLHHQRHYLDELFNGSFDDHHARAMLHTGVTHHRIHLSPQWYLTSYVHVVCDHLGLILDGSDDDAQAVEAVIALIASTLFDAGLVLDAYEISVAEEIVRDMRPQPVDPATASTGAEPAPAAAATARRRPISKVVLADEDETTARRRFIGLDDDVLGVLRGMADAVGDAMPEVLAGFYRLVAETEGVSDFVPPDVAERLLVNVAEFWRDTVEGEFDRAHAASRTRVGAVHEQIGLAPQYYLAGVARQLSGVLRGLLHGSSRAAGLHREIDALVRAVFFDMSFVVDAYLDARASSLLQTGRFAGQLVAGLANGVAIVDARDRIEYANEHLLGLAGVSAAVLRRMPVEAALPLDGVSELVAMARRSVAGRAAALHRLRGRHLRVTALRVQRTTGQDGQVAIVIDDISDVLRASADLDHEDQRFAHVLAAVHAVAWEIDGDTRTVLAVSRAAEALTGVRDIDFLGRPMLSDLIHADDRERVVAIWATLAEGERAQYDHRIVRPDGDVRWMRSSAVGTTDPTGLRTVSGVSVDITDVHVELELLRARAAGH